MRDLCAAGRLKLEATMPKSKINTDTHNAFALPPLEKLEPQLFELASEVCGHAAKHVDVLILDAVGTDCRPGSPAVRLSGIEHKLGIEGLTVAIDRLRQVYADEVMAELHRRIGAIIVDANDSAVEAGIEPIANPTEPEADDPTSDAEPATDPESMADWTFSVGLGADLKGVA